jgi:hypothetical protein
MSVNPTLYNHVLDYLGTPLSADELRVLNLSDQSMRRLYRLLKAEKERQLSIREQAQLEAFKEAAFYLRMGNKVS